MPRPPTLSYNCPLLWQKMTGDESARYCEVCKHTIKNISLLTREERESLLGNTSNAVCVAYYTHLNGELATLESLRQRSSWRVVQAGVAGVAASVLLVGSGCASQTKFPSTVSAVPHAEAEKQQEDDTVVLTALGIVASYPEKPVTMHGPHGTK